ncbi:hypothetical protein CERZMDRAFT_107406, partial [Cercospora zeae-maydis SCOH1-5]
MLEAIPALLREEGPSTEMPAGYLEEEAFDDDNLMEEEIQRGSRYVTCHGTDVTLSLRPQIACPRSCRC